MRCGPPLNLAISSGQFPQFLPPAFVAALIPPSTALPTLHRTLALHRLDPAHPTTPSNHENVLHSPMEDPNIPEGTPPRSMYIDDQAEEDTVAEMDDSEGDYDDEDSMEARVHRDKEATFIPTLPAQDMEIEQEGETLASGPSNSKLASELFLQDEDSDPETEQYLPPPSLSTTVATVIGVHIHRYFDNQAKDSDEDADEEHEEEEQEMEEDRGFLNLTSPSYN
ncbi:hypothetical protein B0H14DRAFT_3504157 [Mycena olivaceomarginata]|nr:hypothetical protein B0H14DRAFT_3504157 [Mycena olivaceomarginata]